MELYLMQHGESTTEEVDPERPLTATGRADVARVAARAARARVRVAGCYHSGKLRAQQSAEILAAALGADLRLHHGLSPTDPVAPIAAWLRSLDEPAIAVVGHLPFLARLASVLLGAGEETEMVRFRMGGLVALVPSDSPPGRFTLAWALPPDLA